MSSFSKLSIYDPSNFIKDSQIIYDILVNIIRMSDQKICDFCGNINFNSLFIFRNKEYIFNIFIYFDFFLYSFYSNLNTYLFLFFFCYFFFIFFSCICFHLCMFCFINQLIDSISFKSPNTYA